MFKENHTENLVTGGTPEVSEIKISTGSSIWPLCVLRAVAQVVEGLEQVTRVCQEKIFPLRQTLYGTDFGVRNVGQLRAGN